MDSTALQILEQHGIRPSVQRLQVVDFLNKNHIHPTADEIFSALQPEIPTLSKTTIYNVLRLLESGGVVREVTIDEKNVRWELVIGEHAHFKCDVCGKIFDVKMPEMTSDLPEGFVARDVDVYYHGECPECRHTAVRLTGINKKD